MLKCMPGRRADVIPLVELLRYNTPSKTSLSPRDLDKSWILAKPLERELLRWSASPALPASDVARNQFLQFRKLRDVMLEHKGKEGKRRADLVNRFQNPRLAEVSCCVTPRSRRAVRARPWQEALGWAFPHH